MKELSIEDILRIAGGLPVTATLDEVTYLAAADAPEPFDYARLLQAPARAVDAG